MLNELEQLTAQLEREEEHLLFYEALCSIIRRMSVKKEDPGVNSLIDHAKRELVLFIDSVIKLRLKVRNLKENTEGNMRDELALKRERLELLEQEYDRTNDLSFIPVLNELRDEIYQLTEKQHAEFTAFKEKVEMSENNSKLGNLSIHDLVAQISQQNALVLNALQEHSRTILETITEQNRVILQAIETLQVEVEEVADETVLEEIEALESLLESERAIEEVIEVENGFELEEEDDFETTCDDLTHNPQPDTESTMESFYHTVKQTDTVLPQDMVNYFRDIHEQDEYRTLSEMYVAEVSTVGEQPEEPFYHSVEPEVKADQESPVDQTPDNVQESVNSAWKILYSTNLPEHYQFIIKGPVKEVVEETSQPAQETFEPVSQDHMFDVEDEVFLTHQVEDIQPVEEEPIQQPVSIEERFHISPSDFGLFTDQNGRQYRLLITKEIDEFETSYNNAMANWQALNTFEQQTGLKWFLPAKREADIMRRMADRKLLDMNVGKYYLSSSIGQVENTINVFNVSPDFRNLKNDPNRIYHKRVSMDEVHAVRLVARQYI